MATSPSMQPPDIRLLCGARIEILAERVLPDDPAVRRLLALTAARAAALWLTDGETRACLAEGEDASALPQALRLALARATDDSAASAPAFEADSLYRRHDPTALAIAALARQMGWSAALVRPKGPTAPPPIPGIAYLRADAVEAFAELALDPWTAVCATSHDIEADGAVLAAALPSKAGYVGVLGSRRRIPERIEALRAARVDAEAIARLKAPIGLPIGAQSPYEIAVSVLAEVIGTFKAQAADRRWPR